MTIAHHHYFSFTITLVSFVCCSLYPALNIPAPLVGGAPGSGGIARSWRGLFGLCPRPENDRQRPEA